MVFNDFDYISIDILLVGINEIIFLSKKKNSLSIIPIYKCNLHLTLTPEIYNYNGGPKNLIENGHILKDFE